MSNWHEEAEISFSDGSFKCELHKNFLDFALGIPMTLRYTPIVFDKTALYVATGVQVDIPLKSKILYSEHYDAYLRDKKYDVNVNREIHFGRIFEIGFIHSAPGGLMGIDLRAVMSTSYNQYGMSLTFFFDRFCLGCDF